MQWLRSDVGKVEKAHLLVRWILSSVIPHLIRDLFLVRTIR